VNWAYLAGFTDGDGCITLQVKGQYVVPRIRWAQKEADSAVLDRIAEFLDTQGFKNGGRSFSVARAGHKYPQRELWITNNEDTRRALIEMLPYLVVKRDRAAEAVDVLNTIHGLKLRFGNKYRVRLLREAG
jgi:hypothetical protein